MSTPAYPEDEKFESGAEINDDVMRSIRAKYEVLDRIIKHPQYDGKAVQSEAWQAFKEIRWLRHKVAKNLALVTSAELVEELYSRITDFPPASGTING